MQALQRKTLMDRGVTMTLTNSLLIHVIGCVLVMLFAASNDVSQSTTTTDAVMRSDSGRMFDKYGALSVKEENARLDNLAAQLRKEPYSKGYVVIYEGSEDHIRDLKARACHAIQHLVVRRGANSKHVVAMVITGGHREKFTVELWMWPLEASDDLPRFQLGVSEKEASIIKGVEVTGKCGRRR